MVFILGRGLNAIVVVEGCKDGAESSVIRKGWEKQGQERVSEEDERVNGCEWSGMRANVL